MTVEEIKILIQQNTPDPAVALAQAQAESGFRERAVSPVGASGIFQFMPATWGQYGGGADIFDVMAQINARNNYMADLLGMFGGEYAKALASYNWGPGRVMKASDHFGAEWFAHIPPETQNYVRKILGNQTNFFRLVLKTLQRAKTGNPKKSR